MNVLCFYINIGFSTIAQEMLKKESIFPYKQIFFPFYVGHLSPEHFVPSLEQLILVHDKYFSV